MSNHEHAHLCAHDMTNSHLLVQDFEYYEPKTVEEAVRLLTQGGDDAAVLAGGTYLLVQMKMEQMAPRALVNIASLDGLVGINPTNSGLEIGAMTTIWHLRNADEVQASYSALADACAAFGSTQIQLSGTIGGNVCNGSPASDAVPALVSLGGEVIVVGPAGERILPVEAFLVGPGQVALEPGELLRAVRLPQPQGGSGSAFVKISRVRADLAKASAAAMVVREGDTIVDCRLTFGAVGPTVIRAEAAERVLVGQKFSSEAALAAGETASREVSPIDDIRSTAEYRRRVVRALTHDALVAAFDRAGDRREAAASAREGDVNGVDAGSRMGPPLHLSAEETHTISITVNGVVHRLRVKPNELLVNVLRERLDLTGTKYGCGIGECGACTVQIDGIPTLSCLTLAVSADGKEITTVEGLEGPHGELDPLQEAFIENDAFQCGYCTPGMLMMTKRLLEENPAPDEQDIRDYLKGNRCRCTGFASIVRAVRSCSGA